jgi:hypothetical protein
MQDVLDALVASLPTKAGSIMTALAVVPYYSAASATQADVIITQPKFYAIPPVLGQRVDGALIGHGGTESQWAVVGKAERGTHPQPGAIALKDPARVDEVRTKNLGSALSRQEAWGEGAYLRHGAKIY